MKILLVHARYAQRGGEDQVFETERDLLRAHGHEVFEYERHNKAIHGLQVLAAGLQTVWSQGDYLAVRKRIRETGAQIVAVHNFFPLISPSVYYAAKAEGRPVVQTLHNYRLICPAATLLRKGAVCRDCVGKLSPLPAILHACYRSNRGLTAGVAAMTTTHNAMATWNRVVTRFIALTEAMKAEYVAGGFDPQRIEVKPNSTEDAAVGQGTGDFFLFVGRLSPEKGVSVLLRAWANAKTQAQLLIVGTGPDEGALRQQASRLKNVQFLQHHTRERVSELMGNARALVVPSIWPEAFGLTVIESFAKGTPVIATRIGALQSLIDPGQNGFTFERADSSELARWLGDDVQYGLLRANARRTYDERYTPERNYARLMEIYQAAIAESNPHATMPLTR